MESEVFVQPIAVNWNFTNLCNFKCSHCYSVEMREDQNETDTAGALKIVKILSENNINIITFGGGESLLRKDIFNVLKECNKLGISTRIITNGYILDRKMIKYLKEFSVDQILISLDGASKEIHDSFRNKPGSFDKVVQAIKIMNEEDVDYIVLTNFNSNNFETRSDFFKLIKSLNVKYWRVNELKKLGISEENYIKLKLETYEVEILHKDLYKFQEEWNGRVSFDSVFANVNSPKKSPSIIQGCHCSQITFGIRSNGDVTPCVYLPVVIGNIFESSINEIWQSSKLIKDIRDKKPRGKCEKCEHFYECKGGCFARAFLEGYSIEDPDPVCWV